MPRATPKSVEERRRDIIAAAQPLIAEQGIGVSTRRIADAVGIAEGTLFRVFPTKGALIHAVMAQALDPTDMVDQLDAIAPDLPLVDRVGQVLDVVRRSTERTRALVLALREQAMTRADGPGTSGDPRDRATGFGRPFGFGPSAGRDSAGHGPAGLRQTADSFHQAVERVLGPDRERLVVNPDDAASFILIFCMSYLMPPVSQLRLDPDLAAQLIARALLDPGKESPE